MLIESVHTVRVQLKNLSYQRLHLVERVVKVKFTFINYLQKLCFRRISEVDSLESASLTRLNKPVWEA